MPNALDYGQTMWAGKEKAKFMSAMMLPDYDYITDTDRSVLFDKKVHKVALGDKKDYDGWNFGYQCFNSMTLVSMPYTNQQYPMYSQARAASILPVTNLKTCLAACKTNLAVPASQTALKTGNVGCCMFDPSTKGCWVTPGAANMGYTGKTASYMIFD